MAEISSESYFSGTIANMIPEGPLNKMVPPTEDHGGGGGGMGVGGWGWGWVDGAGWGWSGVGVGRTGN